MFFMFNTWDCQSLIGRVEIHDEKARTFSRYEKTKFECCKFQDNGLQKGRRKRKKPNRKWKCESVEEGKEMLCLRIKMQRNGDLTNHIREKMKRANVMMKQVWET